MNQSIYQNIKSAFIRPIRVIRVPLASIRLCLLAALLLLSFTAAAAQSDLPATIWESPDKLYDDLYTPGHIFSEEENDVFQSGFEFFAEATETYNQEDVVLRAGGTEGEGGDPTKLSPVGGVPVWLIVGLSVLYAMKARKGKARRRE